MRLYLIRHGHPNYETDRLTETGIREASTLAEYFDRTPFHQIFSSPLGRARETAQFTADRQQKPVTILPWTQEIPNLREIGTEWAAWDIHGHHIRNANYLKDPHHYSAIPTLPALRLREVTEEIQKGSDLFLASLGFQREGTIYRIIRPNQDRIALFCHGGFGLTWLAMLLEIPIPLMWAGFFLPTSSVTTILFDERTPGIATPRCLGVGALPHLAIHQIPPSTAGIKANTD